MKLAAKWALTGAYITVLIAFPPYRYYAMGTWIIGHLAYTTAKMRGVKRVS
jgi:hypothetical protein